MTDLIEKALPSIIAALVIGFFALMWGSIQGLKSDVSTQSARLDRLLEASKTKVVVSDDITLSTETPGFKEFFEPGIDAEVRRRFVQHIDFGHQFAAPPKVNAALSSFVLGGDVSYPYQRLLCRPTNVTATGFDCELATWGKNKVYDVGVTWTAHD